MVESLSSNSLSSGRGRSTLFKKSSEGLILGSNQFSIGDMTGIFSQYELAHELQLITKDFITHEIRTKESSISISDIVCLVKSDIREETQLTMHDRVLLVR